MHEDLSSDAPRWLDADERLTWLVLVSLLQTLPGALDAQLQRDSGLSFFEYMVLAMLSEQEDRTLRMSRLAAVTNGSMSRLSHVAAKLERRGLPRGGGFSRPLRPVPRRGGRGGEDALSQPD